MNCRVSLHRPWWTIALPVLSMFLACAPGNSQDEDAPRTLVVLNHVTGWSLDAAGYHPAVFVLLENVSGRDLSGTNIRLQGRFSDVHTLEVSVAKMELRRPLKPTQQFRLAIIAPKAYELPREVSYWPVMESKVMARVGDVGDEGTETLLVTRIDSTTETQDDAFQRLNEITSYKGRDVPRKPPQATSPKTPKSAEAPPKSAESLVPLAATPAKIKNANPVSTTTARTIHDLFNLKSLPGLGDDFYEFEQLLGLPSVTDSKRKEFTWARYKHRASDTYIVVCSKDLTGKADLIVLQVPKKSFSNEQQLFSQAKSLAGKMRGQSLGPPTKSVRYLASGRIEITTCQAQGYRMVCLSTPDDGSGEGSFIITLNRLPQETSSLLLDQAKDNAALKGFPLLKP